MLTAMGQSTLFRPILLRIRSLSASSHSIGLDVSESLSSSIFTEEELCYPDPLSPLTFQNYIVVFRLRITPYFLKLTMTDFAVELLILRILEALQMVRFLLRTSQISCCFFQMFFQVLQVWFWYKWPFGAQFSDSRPIPYQMRLYMINKTIIINRNSRWIFGVVDIPRLPIYWTSVLASTFTPFVLSLIRLHGEETRIFFIVYFSEQALAFGLMSEIYECQDHVWFRGGVQNCLPLQISVSSETVRIQRILMDKTSNTKENHGNTCIFDESEYNLRFRMHFFGSINKLRKQYIVRKNIKWKRQQLTLYFQKSAIFSVKTS